MNNLLAGKTRKEASRMFFETLVCLSELSSLDQIEKLGYILPLFLHQLLGSWSSLWYQIYLLDLGEEINKIIIKIKEGKRGKNKMLSCLRHVLTWKLRTTKLSPKDLI